MQEECKHKREIQSSPPARVRLAAVTLPSKLDAERRARERYLPDVAWSNAVGIQEYRATAEPNFGPGTKGTASSTRRDAAATR